MSTFIPRYPRKHCHGWQTALLSFPLMLFTGCNQADPDERAAGSGDPSSTSTHDGTMPNNTDVGTGTDEGIGTDPEPAETEDSEDPNAGPGPDNGDQIADVDEYFPLVDGGSWTYRHSHPINGEWLEEVTMTAVNHEGTPSYLVKDSSTLDDEFSEQIWQTIGTGIFRVYREQFTGNDLMLRVTYDPGFLRFDAEWQAPGTVVNNGYRREETNAGGTVSAAIREQKFTVLETGVSVDVEAGTFDDCLLVERERADNGKLKRYWYARGVGKVREENPTTQAQEELVSSSLLVL